ncbi:MAG: hypothetical protein EOO16_05710 [Chitinophagaceae bacterium]|nr:MAG: hypothetical protein EOO16_05710 [Chitinophagaceae bacterium]
MRPAFLLLFLLLHQAAGCQDLSGTWTGTTANDRDRVRLVLIRAGARYVGYSYDESEGLGACTANFSGTFAEALQRLHGGDKGIAAARLDSAELTFDLHFRKADSTDLLEGTFNARRAWFTEGAIALPVLLRRSGTPTDTTVFMREALAAAANEKPTAAPALLHLRQARRDEVIREIETGERELVLRVYDNGTADGDTVSVLHNNTVVADHQPVRERYFEIRLQLNEREPLNEITLIAHNLGAIAPNTASLTIIAGEARYRLTASTDLQRNAVVRVRYRPKPIASPK